MNLNDYFVRQNVEYVGVGVEKYSSQITVNERVLDQLQNPMSTIKHAYNRLLIHNLELANEKDRLFWVFKGNAKEHCFDLSIKANVATDGDFVGNEIEGNLCVDIWDEHFIIQSFGKSGYYTKELIHLLAKKIDNGGLNKNHVIYSRVTGATYEDRLREEDTVTITNELFIKRKGHDYVI